MSTGQDYLLVVEDDPDILQFLKTTLTFHGYRVTTARNGYEGLAVVQKERPALVIADIMMPKMDGFGLVNRLRMNADTYDIPVVLVTATYIAPEDRQFAQNIGVTSFVQKPIDLEEFLRIIRELLDVGAHTAPESLRGPGFYDAYRRRLEAKLVQKNAQVARNERLLKGTLSAEEHRTVQIALSRAMNERAELELLLQHIQDQRGEER